MYRESKQEWGLGRLVELLLFFPSQTKGHLLHLLLNLSPTSISAIDLGVWGPHSQSILIVFTMHLTHQRCLPCSRSLGLA